MRERASLVGGSFQVEGRRGKGTVVTVRIDLPAGARVERKPEPVRRQRR